MTGVEILLLLIGTVFFIVSFFITEKLSTNELSKIGELSNEEIEKVMERELERVTGEIGSKVEEKVDDALLQSERSMEKESNEKIMAISEFSDTIIESMNKTHNEIMFLYSMLNDKHTELTKLSAEMQKLSNDIENRDESITNRLQRMEIEKEIEKREETINFAAAVSDGQDNIFPKEFDDLEEDESNHNKKILRLYKQGKSIIEIAREMELGLGEVQLVIGLYKGDKNK